MTRSPIDVVVVSYNRRELLLECCRSVLEALPTAQVIVVDNASDDGSANAVRDQLPAVELIDAGANLGFARAVNLGAARGTAPMILLLNSDARIGAGAAELLHDALLTDPDGAGAGPLLRDSSGALELSVGRTMTLRNELVFKILGTLHRGGRGPATAWLERRHARRRDVESLSAACLLLRRQAFEQAEGMDERFFLYAEDVDLCTRLAAAGWHFVFVPDATVTHVRGASAELDAESTERVYRASQLAFYRKHHSAGAVAALRLFLMGRYLAAALLARGPHRAHARAMFRWSVRPQ